MELHTRADVELAVRMPQMHSGTRAADAINGTLQVLGIGIIVAAAVVMGLRHVLVRRGQIAPLSMPGRPIGSLR